MLPAVDEYHRDLLGIAVRQHRVIEDRHHLVLLPQLCTDFRHDDLGVLAQVTSRLTDDSHARHHPILANDPQRGMSWSTTVAGMTGAYRVAGEAAAAAVDLEAVTPGTRAAFFDVDNTIMRGASIYHLGVGLARLKYFTMSDIRRFALKQMKFVMSGSENLEDIASAIAAALSFVEGRDVAELGRLGDQIFDDVLSDKLIPETLELARAHLDAGDQVWLVTATPNELAQVLARRLGLTGALGTVSEIVDGKYTGQLVGVPLHGPAKAEAVRALAAREGLDLDQCWAYSDSANDIPMLSAVGHPVAVNPDKKLRAHARHSAWEIKDFRRRAHIQPYVAPALVASAVLIGGIAAGTAARRRGR